ncbi:MFS transporter, partial [Salmonella enterica subsp. enterica serovar Infantis]
MYTPLNRTTTQRQAACASITSWLLDSCDFFLLVLVLSDRAARFHAS